MPSITEGGEYTGESGKVYLAVGTLGQSNVWTAVQKDDHSNIVVLKAPSDDDTDSSWPRFQHEMIMHELFKDCRYIRRQLDRVAPLEGQHPPLLVLEITETTLWQARTKRPFSKDEIRSVARSMLQGLKEVHDKGLVYVDIKMQNIMLNGFNTSEQGDGSKIVAKLGDLGIVMEPIRATAQPVVYRAPEVFFKGELAQAADIWAFGLVVSHLLEAQRRFSFTGMYDDLHNGSGSMFEREQAMRSAIANDYDISQEQYYKDCALPINNSDHKPGQHWGELRSRGLDEDDVEFLKWVMAVDPRKRPTAATILGSKWLGGEGSVQTPTFKHPFEGSSQQSAQNDKQKTPPPSIVDSSSTKSGTNTRKGQQSTQSSGPKSSAVSSDDSVPTKSGTTAPRSQKIAQTDSSGSSTSNLNEVSPPKMRKANPTSSKKSVESTISDKRVVSNKSPVDAQKAAQTAHANRPASAWPTSSIPETDSTAVDSPKVAKSSGAESPAPVSLGKNASAGGTYLSYR
ncbi:kinase-like protein [Hortaea werneckii]|nr:kinase-like protein [Hortaea werneckii]